MIFGAVAASVAPEKQPLKLEFTEDMYVNEAFTSDTGQFTQFSISASTGTFSVTGGQAVITNITGATRDRFVKCGQAINYPVGWFQIDVISVTGSPANWNIGAVGIAKDGQNSIFAEHDALNNQTRITTAIGGVFTTRLVSNTLTGDYRLALSIYKNRLAVYSDVNLNDSWTQVLAIDVEPSVGDLTALDLSTWFPCFGASSSNNATCVWTYDNFKAWTSRLDYFELLPPDLILYENNFSTATELTLTGTSVATASIVSNQLQLEDAGSGTTFAQFAGQAELNMPQCFAQIDVVSQSTNVGRVGVGVEKDSTHYIFARYSKVDSNISIIANNGSGEAVLFSTAYTGNPPFKLGFSMVADSCCAWIDEQGTNGNGWQVKASGNVSGTVSLRTVIQAGQGWKPAIYMSNTGACTYTLDNFKIGRFGATAIRDPNLVTYEDGTPLIQDGVLTFTATATDGRGIGTFGIFELDLETRFITQKAVILVSRDGLVQNDIDGTVLYYDNGDRRFFVSTWGNGFGGVLEVLHRLVSGTEILQGSHVISGMSALALTNLNGVGGSGRYHCHPVKRDGVWTICYDVTTTTNFGGNTFYIAVDTSNDLVSFSALGNDTANRDYEGSHQNRFDGRRYFMTGGDDHSRVYDSNLTFVGNLDAEFVGGIDTFPHPVVFGYGNKQVLLTFDNVRFQGIGFAWGNFRLHSAPRYK